MPPARDSLEDTLEVASDAPPKVEPFTGRLPPREGARRRALNALFSLELELGALEAIEPRGEEFAFVLSIVRDRLERHHLQPHRAVISEWDCRAAA